MSVSIPAQAGDFRWPSNTNELEIPDLRLDLCPVGPDMPLVAWGSRVRSAQFRGTWHFYVDDYRFTRVWEQPESVVETGAVGAVELNYSVFDQTPFPIALIATYRKRWLARFWQERGLAVWVDLNVSETHSELNLLGVPRGWKHYATRGYDERVDDLVRECALARVHAGGEAQLLVYGGGAVVAECVKSMPGALHFPEKVGPRHFARPKLELVKHG